jgi:anti-sigma regulatory factor (Ser/Thr protein kinase)
VSLPAGQTIDLTSDPCQLSVVRESVRTWISALGWGELRIADVVLAVDEALTNVMRHGYENQTDRPIRLFMRTVNDPARGVAVEIEIRDWGRQVPLDQIRGRDLDDLRPGGLGVHIIRNLMDYADYSHAEGGGMRLLMRKYDLPGAPA